MSKSRTTFRNIFS